MELPDRQESKMKGFREHDDSMNAIRRLAKDKKDISNSRNKERKRLRCGKIGHLPNNKICKSADQKIINYVDEKKPEVICYIDLSAPESDTEFTNT